MSISIQSKSSKKEQNESNGAKLQSYQKKSPLIYSYMTVLERYESFKLKQMITAFVPPNQRRMLYQKLRKINPPSENDKLITDNVCALIDQLVYVSSVVNVADIRQCNMLLEKIIGKMPEKQKYAKIQTQFSEKVQSICKDWQKPKLKGKQKKQLVDRGETIKNEMRKRLQQIEQKNMNQIEVPQFINLLWSKKLVLNERCEEMLILKIEETKGLLTNYIQSMEKNTNELKDYLHNISLQNICKYKHNVFEDNENEIRKQPEVKPSKIKSILKQSRWKQPPKVVFADEVSKQIELNLKAQSPKDYFIQMFPLFKRQVQEIQREPTIAGSESISLSISVKIEDIQQEFIESQSPKAKKQNKTESSRMESLTKQFQNNSKTISHSQLSRIMQRSQDDDDSEIPLSQYQKKKEVQTGIDYLDQLPSSQILHQKFCKNNKVLETFQIKSVQINNLKFEIYGIKDPLQSKKFVALFFEQFGYMNQQGANEGFWKVFPNIPSNFKEVVKNLDAGKKVIIIGAQIVMSLIMERLGPQLLVVVQAFEDGQQQYTQIMNQFDKVSKYPRRQKRSKKHFKDNPLETIKASLAYLFKKQMANSNKQMTDYHIVFRKMVSQFLKQLEPRSD